MTLVAPAADIAGTFGNLLTFKDLAATEQICTTHNHIYMSDIQKTLFGGNVNKLELISVLREKANLCKPEAAKIVDLVFDKMSDALASGDRVEIRGLCSFHVKKYKSYVGRNPRTGEKVSIKPKKYLSLKQEKN